MAAENKRTTIADVAACAGVSTTTISRYLNNKFEFMSAESRERIAGVIEKLNYRPNGLARGLKSQQSRLIGLIVADITNPFSAILVKGIDDSCRHYGYGLMVANTDQDPQKERRYILSMLDQRVEGFIIQNTGENDAFFQNYNQKETPIVLAERPIGIPPLFDTVQTNDVEAVYTVMRELAARGYEQVGYFTKPLHNVQTRQLRSQSYRRAYQELFSGLPQEFILTEKEPAIVQVEKFLQENTGKRAILTANGVVTLQVLKACKALGVRYPLQLGIVSFDDWEWMELSDISAIDQPAYKIGVECVKRLMRRIHRNRNAKPKLQEIPCKFHLRGSIS